MDSRNHEEYVDQGREFVRETFPRPTAFDTIEQIAARIKRLEAWAFSLEYRKYAFPAQAHCYYLRRELMNADHLAYELLFARLDHEDQAGDCFRPELPLVEGVQGLRDALSCLHHLMLQLAWRDFSGEPYPCSALLHMLFQAVERADEHASTLRGGGRRLWYVGSGGLNSVSIGQNEQKKATS